MYYCIETKRRIQLAVAAYAYEFDATSIMTDKEFDDLATLIQPSFMTNNQPLDQFFSKQFSPFTGQWIHNHPELDKIKGIYNTYYKLRSPHKNK